MDPEFSGNASSYQTNDQLDLKKFENNLNVSVLEKSEGSLQLHIKGLDAPLMNALRRIMMDEVQTMAIDRVVMYQNTSVINDEVLVHRLGLIPINADPSLFIQKREGDSFADSNTVKFLLHVKCDEENNNETLYGKTGDDQVLNVYASDLVLDKQFHSKSDIHQDIR